MKGKYFLAANSTEARFSSNTTNVCNNIVVTIMACKSLKEMKILY
jgi:hypothetical protein